MKFCLYLEYVSPHVMPLLKRIVVQLGETNVRYVFTKDMGQRRLLMGWTKGEHASWIMDEREHPQEAREWLEDCPCLMCSMRDVELFQLRSRKGLKTFYTGERWFKPLSFFGGRVMLPGRLRMLVPSYRRRALAILKLINTDPGFRYLGVGRYAVSDMVGLGGCRNKITTWAYYVERSEGVRDCENKGGRLRLLWVGSMFPLKNVDVIIRALRSLDPEKYILTIVGDGPQKNRIIRLASGLPVTFLPSQPMDRVRLIMRQHDVFVFPSNSCEGWGAVVSEALEEGMRVVGSVEAGACATILPEGNLFHCRDWRRLASLLSGQIASVEASQWSADAGARRLLELIGD